MRHVPFLLTLLLAGCGHSASSTLPRPAPRREVVVLLVVDQLAGWIAHDRIPLLPSDGGFARLSRESEGLRILEFAHGVTDTAPGHSSLFTGRSPSESGIGANEVVDASGTNVSILRDEATRLITSYGVSEKPGSSLTVLHVATIADRFRARRPDGRIVALSLKDRATLFGAGRQPDAALFFEPTLNAFVTSTAVTDAIPVWAHELASHASVVARELEPWTMLDDAFVREHVRLVDAAPGEGNLFGFGTTFPHDFAASSRPGYAFRASPRSDEALIDLAIASMDAYAHESNPLMLMVSLSATDYVGHIFGPSSWEAWDQIRRLDAQLARLFVALDAHYGADGWSALLSADHGALAMPEEELSGAPWCGHPDAFFDRPCSGVVRIDVEGIPRTVEAALVAELGAGPWVLGFADPYLRLTYRALALEGAARDRRDRVIESTVRAFAGVAEVINLRTTTRCDGAASFTDSLCRSFVRELGSFYVAPTNPSFFDSGYVPGFGGGHGSPSLFHRRVPFFARLAPHHAALSVGAPDAIVPFTRYFEFADRMLGGDGVPTEVADH